MCSGWAKISAAVPEEESSPASQSRPTSRLGWWVNIGRPHPSPWPGRSQRPPIMPWRQPGRTPGITRAVEVLVWKDFAANHREVIDGLEAVPVRGGRLAAVYPG